MITPSGTIPMESHIVGHIFKLSFPVTKNEGWFCGEGGGMIRHFINGNWTWDQANITGYSNAIKFIDNLNGWVVGDRIKHTSNGFEWFDQINHEPLVGDLEDVNFITINEGWTVGISGQVFHTTNGGEYWEKVDIGAEDFLVAVQLTSPVCGYIVGHNKAIYKYMQINGEEEQGSGEAGKQGSVEVWPNPTSGVFSLQSSVFSQWSAVVEILDLRGNMLKQWNPETLEPWNPGTTELDISQLPAGVYYVRISSSNSLIVKKIVKL
jgi:hypothetical protein